MRGEGSEREEVECDENSEKGIEVEEKKENNK